MLHCTIRQGLLKTGLFLYLQGIKQEMAHPTDAAAHPARPFLGCDRDLQCQEARNAAQEKRSGFAVQGHVRLSEASRSLSRRIHTLSGAQSHETEAQRRFGDGKNDTERAD